MIAAYHRYAPRAVDVSCAQRNNLFALRAALRDGGMGMASSSAQRTTNHRRAASARRWRDAPRRAIRGGSAAGPGSGGASGALVSYAAPCVCLLDRSDDGPALQVSLVARSSPTARRAVSLLLLTMRAIGRGADGWSSFASADLLERVRDELARPVLQKVAIPTKPSGTISIRWEAKLIDDARLMLAFTSEAPN
jgi:hypothetical protein